MGKEDGDPGGPMVTETSPAMASAEPTAPLLRQPKDPKMQAARIKMLDGTYKELELSRGAMGDELFQESSRDLSIEEKEYFSLCFYDAEHQRHWLYNDKKILRQLKGLPWDFSFEVKFYPTAPTTMKDDLARYNLYLQLRRDIYSQRLPATVPTHAILASLVAQSEFGDANQTAEYQEFLRTAKIAPNMNDELLDQIIEAHKEHRGMTASEAETAYIETCKNLSMYGVFRFDAKDDKKQDVQIGVCSSGVNVYREGIRVHRFAWQSIVKIAYRKRAFNIRLKPGEVDKKETTLAFTVPSYQHSKRIWKCGVEHHTFFRLIQPEDKPKSGGLFNFGSGRFRYHGRTQFQTKMASQMFDRPGSANVQRSPSARMNQSLSLDNVAKEQQGELQKLSYTEDIENRDPTRSPGVSYDLAAGKRTKTDQKGKKSSKKTKKESEKAENEANSSDSSSESEDEQTKRLRLVAVQEGGQPETLVSSWQENQQLPDEVVVEYDEHGNKITRTIKTSQVKHTVQKHTYQNFIVTDDNGVEKVERSREQITPIGGGVSSEGKGGASSGPMVETETRTVSYESNEPNLLQTNSELGEFVSSKTVTTGNRTVETITYKTEKDGVIETHVEHRVTIHSEAPIDHDSELSAAIMEATQMNPDMTVEKIEVRQESTG